MRGHAPWSRAILGSWSLLALACQQAPATPREHEAGDTVAADAPSPPGDGDSDSGDPQAAWSPFAVLSLNLHCLKQDGTAFADLQSLTYFTQGAMARVAAGSPACLAMQSYGYTHVTESLGSTLIDHLYAHRGAALRVLSTELMFDGAPYPAVSDHPGVLAVLAPVSPAAVTQTRIDATVDVGFGNFVAVRGDAAPLSWDAGWPGVAVAADRWSLVLTELGQGQSFAYKCVRNDRDYQTGPNVAGTGGQTNLDAPSF